jgi:hypothetical protein
MDRESESEQAPDKGGRGEAIEKQAEDSRKTLDDIPAPGTDPLHEGP